MAEVFRSKSSNKTIPSARMRRPVPVHETITTFRNRFQDINKMFLEIQATIEPNREYSSNKDKESVFAPTFTSYSQVYINTCLWLWLQNIMSITESSLSKCIHTQLDRTPQIIHVHQWKWMPSEQSTRQKWEIIAVC